MVPIFFLMLVGVAYMAMGFNLQMVLNGAVREGARAWAKNPALGNENLCTPPKCTPGSGQTNFAQYIEPIVRQYMTDNGFDGNSVTFETKIDDGVSVTLMISYPYNLPLGNFAQQFVPVTVSANCILKKG